MALPRLPRRIFVLTTPQRETDTSIAKSYAAAAARTLPKLRRLGEVCDLSLTESRIDYWDTFVRCPSEPVIHLMFRPVKALFLTSLAPNVAYLLPEKILWKARASQWVGRLNQLDLIVTHSATLKKRLSELGVTTPVRVFARDRWSLICDLFESVSASEPHWVGEALPRILATGEALFVEISSLLFEHYTGVSYLTLRLVEALSKITPLHLFRADLSTNQIFSLGLLSQGTPQAGRVALERSRAKRPLLAPRLLSSKTGLFTFSKPSRRIFRREVAILYDLIPLVLQGCYEKKWQTKFERLYAALEKCDHLIAISQASREDARWLLSLPTSQISVVYPGGSLCPSGHRVISRRRRKKFVLVVSTIEPRKNFAFILRWFRQTQALPPDFELRWVGGFSSVGDRAWTLDLAMELASLKESRIKFLGRVDERTLCDLYQQASFTLVASLYEGFGLPVIDSLLHRTPVLASYHSSLKELAGPGVFPIDPGNVETLDVQCRRAMRFDRALIDTARVRERFSWPALARHTLSVCQRGVNETASIRRRPLFPSRTDDAVSLEK